MIQTVHNIDEDEEVFETFNAQDDFDQINEEKQNFSKYTTSNYMQDIQGIDQVTINQKDSQKLFDNESHHSKINRFFLQKSRQVQIGNRLINIRLEMQKLQKQLQQNCENQKQIQQQASQAVDKNDKDNGDQNSLPKESQLNIQKSEENLKIAQEQLDQFKFLKEKLIKLYQLQGFKNMVKSNPNMSQFLGLIQQDFMKEGNQDNMISQQVTGRQVNMMEFNRMIEKIRYTHNQKQKQKDSWNENPEININIVYDKSRKDLGVLIRLNNLMKRLEVIKYLIGTWKPTTKKYQTMTEQVRYVHKKLELLNEAKILHFQGRAAVLKEEVDNLRQACQNDPKDKLQQRENEMGHDSELILKLFKETKGVKAAIEQIPNIVDRINQKAKVHDMAAQILLTIEKLEEQQKNILNSAAKENKIVLEAIQKGIKENQETIKLNVDILQAKIGVKKNI